MIEQSEITGARVRRIETTEETQAGNGAPGHTAADGTYYWDYTNADLYVNDSGVGTFGNSWQHIGGGGVAVPHTLLNNPWHTDTTTNAPAQGDIIFAQGAAPIRWNSLAHPGAANHVLQSTAAEVGWSANAVTFPAAGAVPVGTGANTQVTYWTGANTLAGDAGMTYNAGANTLTVGAIDVSSGGDVDPADASGQDLGDATHRWDLYTQAVYFGGASGANIIQVPDNVADALHISDAGGIEYLKIISTDAQPIVRWNDGGVDVDHYVEAVGVADAFVIRGSDGQCTIGALGTGYVYATAGVLSIVDPIPLTDLGSYAQGRIIYGGGADWTTLAHPGAANRVLQSTAAEVAWSANAVTFPAAGAVPVGTGQNNYVTYWTGVNTITGTAGFQYTVGTETLLLESSTSNLPLFDINNSNNDAVSAILRFRKQTATPADGDDSGIIEFYATDSGVVGRRLAYILGEALDITAADRAGGITFEVVMDATDRNLLQLSGYNGAVNQGEVIINEDAQDVDFRVESSADADALEIRGSDSQVTLGVLTAGYVTSTAGGVLGVVTEIALADLADYTQGDIIIGGAADWEDLAISGNNYDILGVNAAGTEPEWQTFDWDNHIIAAGGDGVHNHSNANEGGALVIGTTDTDATAGSIFFAGVAGVIQEDNANFFWDDGNNRLGLGRNTPGVRLDVYHATDNIVGLFQSGDDVGGIRLEDDDTACYVYAADGSLYLGGDAAKAVTNVIIDDGTGYTGIGIAPSSDTHLYVYDNTLSSAATFYGIQSYHIKTAGAGGVGDDYYGMYSYMDLNQSTTIDNLYGGFFQGTLTAGTTDLVIGAAPRVDINGGTINQSARGMSAYVTLDGGTIEDAYGSWVYMDIGAGATVNGDVFGSYIQVDDDGGAAGTVYMLYLAENTGIDWGIYQAGTSDNHFGGTVYVNETANSDMTLGITINQGGNDDELLAGKSSDVGNPFTDYAEADTYFTVLKHSADAGGALIRGFRDDDDDAGWAMVVQGYLGENADTTKTVAGIGVVVIDGLVTDGGTGVGNMNANGNVACFRTTRGGVRETVVIIDEDGDVYYDGALQNYDDFDDALVVEDARRVLSGQWNDAIRYNADALAAMGVISLNDDGTPAMVSHKRMTALLMGAVGQLYDRVKELG